MATASLEGNPRLLLDLSTAEAFAFVELLRPLKASDKLAYELFYATTEALVRYEPRG